MFIKDITNKRFGFLIAKSIAPDRQNGSGQIRWTCICDCGNETTIPSQDVRNGRTTSCGCMKYKLIAEKNKIFIKKKRFGKLLVIEQFTIKIGKDWCYECKCDCGNSKNIRKRSLIQGNTTSCGCDSLNKNIMKINKIGK